MLQNLTGWHALIILAVVLLIFGATKLPALARSVGQSMRILKDEVRADEASAHGTPDAEQPTPRPDKPLTTAIPTHTPFESSRITERAS